MNTAITARGPHFRGLLPFWTISLETDENYITSHQLYFLGEPLGTSTAAKPRRVRRTTSALRDAASGKKIVQTVITDTKDRLSAGAQGAAAALVVIHQFAESVLSKGSQKTLRDIDHEIAEKATLPLILAKIGQNAVDLVPPTPKPTLLNDLAAKALVQTWNEVLQGEGPDIDISRREIERNLERTVVQVGAAGLLSTFMGNYIAGITFFYAGRLVAQNLGVTDRLKDILGKRAMERDVRTQSEEIGSWLGHELLRRIPAKSFESEDVESVARVLSRLLSQIAEEYVEESD